MDKNFSKFLKCSYLYERCEMCWKEWKSMFRFSVFEIWSFLYSKLVNFSMIFKYKINHNSKSKNWKIYFLFDIALRNIIKMGAILTGVCISLVGKIPSAALNEKLIFRLLFFELWLIVFKMYQKQSILKAAKFTGKMRIALKIII